MEEEVRDQTHDARVGGGKQERRVDKESAASAEADSLEVSGMKGGAEVEIGRVVDDKEWAR